MFIIRRILKSLALVATLDGLLTALWGPGFLRWLRDHLPFPVPPVAAWFLTWPEGVLRVGGAAQAVIAWRVMAALCPNNKNS